MSDIVMRTGRLALRLWRDGDDDRLAKIQTPSVMRWLQDADMAERRPGSTTERMRRLQAEHGHCFWVVERIEDGAFLGHCGLKRVDAQGTALTGAFEIGWIFGEAFWGVGYATEAARAALDRAFAVHDAPFVVALTVEGNGPSRRVMERIGMVRRADLDFHDPSFSAALNPAIVYRMDRADWRHGA
jgi:RimJ/RimL family protein N-acetyltransferase